MLCPVDNNDVTGKTSELPGYVLWQRYVNQDLNRNANPCTDQIACIVSILVVFCCLPGRSP